MSFAIETIDHIQLTVPRDQEDAARRFYGHSLGLQEIPKPEPLQKRGGAWYQVGPTQLHLSVEDIPREQNRASKRHVCFLVPDLAAAEQAARASGLDVIPDKQPIDGFVRFYLRDPGGNRIELAQVL